MIAPQPGIMDISPYVAGEAHLTGHAQVLKLSANENPFGPSPAAQKAFLRAANSLSVYPEGAHTGLREAVADVIGLDPDRVLCGAGSDEIITFLCQAFAGPGDEVIHTEHGFAMYRISALAAGATPVEVPEKARHTDVDAILEAVTDRTRLIFIANPNNPTGTMIPLAEVTRLADGLPDSVLLILDGAYAEYVDNSGFDAGLSLVESRTNVVMTRTFSKIYGLGGLRIGWGYGPAHIMDVLSRVRGPFNISTAALLAAEAAIMDTEYMAQCQAHNSEWRSWLADRLRGIGLPSDPSFGNFILPRFSYAADAAAADEALRDEGILVRRVSSYNLPEALRITIGDEIACRRVADVLTRFMEARR